MRSKKSILSLILSLIMITLQLSGMSVKAIEKNYENPIAGMILNRTVDKNDLEVGEEFTINYNITPKSFKIEPKKKDLDIVLVIDKSESMEIPLDKTNNNYVKDPNGKYYGVYSQYYNHWYYGIVKFNENTKKPYKISIYTDKWGRVDCDIKKDESYRYVLTNQITGYGYFEGSILDLSKRYTHNSRMEAVQGAAENFIDSFKNYDGDVNIGFVSYEADISEKKGLTDKAQFENLKFSINNTLPMGGTNIGDGLRSAYHMLKNSKNQNREKYIVLLTDGDPCYYSWGREGYFFDDDTKYKAIYADRDTVNGLDYAKKMAEKVGEDREANIKSYMIAFTKDIEGSKLKSISNNANYGESIFYKETDNKEGINSVYEDIANSIKKDMYLKDVTVEEILPEGFEVTKLPNGFEIDKNNPRKVIGKLKDIHCILNDKTGEYDAEAINIELKLKAKKPGRYTLGKDSEGKDTSYINYKDVLDKNVSSAFNSVDVNVGSTEYDLIDVKRTVEAEELRAGDTFDVKYTVIPKPIEVNNINKDKSKDIVMVIDDSGSMRYIPGQRREPDYYGEKSRLKIMKDVSKKFINEFNDNDNARISLVRYSNMAKVISDFKEINKYNKDSLNRIIENLSAEGSTNTGDGFRLAYSMLKRENNDHDKYIVFMTDGEAEAYSWNYGLNGYSQYYYENDIYNQNYKVNQTLWNTGWYNRRYYENYPYPDYRYESLQYAKIMANKVAEYGTEDNKIKTFVVGFSKDAGSNNKEIADVANGTYYKAEDENTINNIYESIQKIIQTNVSGKLYMEESLSSNLQVESCPNGFKVENNKLVGNLNNVYYTLSEDGKYYKAEPVEFTVKYKVKENGDLYLGKGNTSFVKMNVLDKSETKKLEECRIESTNSTIINQGIFKGFGKVNNYIHSVKDTKIANTMPINLAMEVEIKTSKSELDLKIQGNINNNSFKFKKYEIKDGVINLNSCQQKEFTNAKEFKFTNSPDFKLEKDKNYIITYTLIPEGNKGDNINIQTSADNNEVKRMNLKIDNLPNVF